MLSQTYFDKYQSLADSLECVYKIPSSIILAIAYHESAGGRSFLARKSNNHFGIVGKNPHYRSRYRYFSSDTASFEGFCRLICSKSFYKRLAGTTESHHWVNAIAKSGYAESSGWSMKIIAIIRRNDLDS